MALLITASVGVASDCADDPNECTPKNLCEIATDTYGSDGNISWSAASSKAKHVKFAQGLGMSCDVIAALDPCDSDPNECKISQLCGKATIDSAGQISWDNSAKAYVALAKEYGLQCDIVADAAAKDVITNFKQAFKSEPKLKRQQLQYALNKLGYYSYGADGLWGKGTSTAFDNFVSGYQLEKSSEVEVFRSLLSEVTVPSSFDEPKEKAIKNGSQTQYACVANKGYVKTSMFEIFIHEGLLGATLVEADGKKTELNQEEVKELSGEFQLDQVTYLKFSDSTVVFLNPQMDEKKISELLKSANPEDRAKLKKAFAQMIAPKKFTIKNNVASWSQKFPKELGIENAIIAHSFNQTTNQYVGKTKMKIAGQSMIIEAWATCDRY